MRTFGGFRYPATPKRTAARSGRPEAQAASPAVTRARPKISGVGQTEAAQDLCSALAPEKKLHHLQEGVGHYGVFNGSRFRREIVPRIVEFVNANA